MRGRLLGQLNAQKVATTQAAGKAAVEQIARLAKAAAAGQLADSRGRILAGAAGAISDAADEVPAPLKLDLMRLVEDSSRRVEVSDLLGRFKQPQPLTEHVNRVNSVIDDAVADATQTASSLIDNGVTSAYASIDAAATAKPD